MTFYHGSPIGDLKELKPFLSEHGKPYLYFATNPLVAALYAVKPVPKPFSFYPYGFDKDGTVVYSEYYEKAFYDTYHNQKGYLYYCHDLKNVQNPTQINCAYTCMEPVQIDGMIEIPDLYEYFKEQEEKGLFRIKPLQEVSEKELKNAQEHLVKMISEYNLKELPEHPMSVFIKTKFPGIW